MMFRKKFSNNPSVQAPIVARGWLFFCMRFIPERANAEVWRDDQLICCEPFCSELREASGMPPSIRHIRKTVNPRISNSRKIATKM